ncbi:MAG: hypothetical protein ABI056_03670 [Caulobacteraceae bacterium]
MASFLGLVAIGIRRVLASGGHPHAVVEPASLPGATQAVSVWLLMRAFAAGCTAMTGVEAVSNAVGAFKAPVVRRAHQTLTMICLALGLLLAGIAAVAHGYALGALDQTKPGHQSLLSQLAGAIVGHGPVYYIAMASLLAVLKHWWERLLHGRRAERLRAALVSHGGPRLNVIIAPWRD